MANHVIEASANLIVEISSVGGDLRITGWDQSQFVADSDDDDIRVEQDGDRLRVQANSDLTIRLPQGAGVSVPAAPMTTRRAKCDRHSL